MLAKQWGLPEDLFTALRFALTPLSWEVADAERSPEQRQEPLLGGRTEVLQSDIAGIGI